MNPFAYFQEYEILVLDEAILSLTLAQNENLGFEEADENRAFRFMAYRQYTLRLHGCLGRRSTRVMPACCNISIRTRFPDPEGKYIQYFANRDKF